MSNRIKELWVKGLWPPEGHPWRGVALLPLHQVKGDLQTQTWLQVLQGLRQVREQAINLMLKSTSTEAEMYEARGVVKTCDMLLQLQGQIEEFHAKMDEGE